MKHTHPCLFLRRVGGASRFEKKLFCVVCVWRNICKCMCISTRVHTHIPQAQRHFSGAFFPCVIVEPAATMNASARAKKTSAFEVMVVIVCCVARRPCSTAAEGSRTAIGVRRGPHIDVQSARLTFSHIFALSLPPRMDIPGPCSVSCMWTLDSDGLMTLGTGVCTSPPPTH